MPAWPYLWLGRWLIVQERQGNSWRIPWHAVSYEKEVTWGLCVNKLHFEARAVGEMSLDQLFGWKWQNEALLKNYGAGEERNISGLFGRGGGQRSSIFPLCLFNFKRLPTSSGVMTNHITLSHFQDIPGSGATWKLWTMFSLPQKTAVLPSPDLVPGTESSGVKPDTPLQIVRSNCSPSFWVGQASSGALHPALRLAF